MRGERHEGKGGSIFVGGEAKSGEKFDRGDFRNFGAWRGKHLLLPTSPPTLVGNPVIVSRKHEKAGDFTFSKMSSYFDKGPFPQTSFFDCILSRNFSLSKKNSESTLT